jgi:hypothetical protein
MFQWFYECRTAFVQCSLVFSPLIVLTVVLRYLAEVAGAAGGMMYIFSLISSLGWKVQISASAPCFLTTISISDLYMVLVPGSLNCEAIVPNTGMVSGSLIKQFMVALVLFLHIAQCIHSAALVKFVDDNNVGKVEHVDLLQAV